VCDPEACIWIEPDYEFLNDCGGESCSPVYEEGDETVCDGMDNDCDGLTDEDVVAAEGVCLSEGICVDVRAVCEGARGWRCDYPLGFENEETACDGEDNDCDGLIDDVQGGCDCVHGEVRRCGEALGVCQQGRQECFVGTWNPCFGAVGPFNEICDSQDNDCDGDTDEDLVAPRGFCLAEGVCGGAEPECSQRGSWTCPYPDTYQVEETLCDGLDNDCDGEIDEGLLAPPGHCLGAGVCVGTAATCAAEQGWVCPYPPGQYEAEEDTCDGLDNDCDGTVDNTAHGCECMGAETEPCSSDVGSCVAGIRTCVNGFWSECSGVLPVAEICDGFDNDCDGQADNNLSPPLDLCAAVGVCEGVNPECRGAEGWGCPYPEVYEAEAEDRCDGLDNDCNGEVDDVARGCDCINVETRPCGTDVGECHRGVQTCDLGRWGACVGAQDPVHEVCDGLDNDCDGTVDDEDAGDLIPLVAPNDLCEQRGVCQGTGATCAGPLGWVCEYPVETYEAGGQESRCDGLDNNCDGVVDNRAVPCACQDGQTQACGSAVGECRQGTQHCAGGAWGACEGAVFPVAERCLDDAGAPDGRDNDCDGDVDEEDAVDVRRWYRDADGDGRGDPQATAGACTQPQGYVDDATDCADDDRLSFPGADERCDGRDNDCDGTIDEGVTQPFWLDADGDEFGNPHVSVQACERPDGYVDDATDCNDGNATVYPDAQERCDGIDNDCDGDRDEGVQLTYYRDADGDLYGDRNVTALGCGQPVGFVLDSTDCNDANRTVWPGAPEVCDGDDNDCDLAIDEDVQHVFYRDADSDGHGDPATTTLACQAPDGYVAGGTDCNDGDRTMYPGAQELCDGKDNNCNGTPDEGAQSTYYRDSDGDGFGDPGATRLACSAPDGYVADNRDCNDGNRGIHPGANELCEGIDNNCSGSADEGCACVNNQTRSCGSSVGDCREGSQRCDINGNWGGCEGEVGPGREVCDGRDNDCDGAADEGLNCDVLITRDNEAYGHHGQCGGWNACGSAATCAQWACEIKGHARVTSHDGGGQCGTVGHPGLHCHLFYSRGSIEWNWSTNKRHWCRVLGTSAIRCQ